MELIKFGHHGAPVIVFPTSKGRFFDWENRSMIGTLSRHLDNGWLQLFCVDSVDDESWYNDYAHPHDRGVRHLQYQEYITKEVIPFVRGGNDNQFTIAMGASFGAYHAASISLRFPEIFKRCVSMSGLFDIQKFTHGYYDDVIHQGNPLEFLRCAHDIDQINQLRGVDWIIPIGREDPNFGDNQAFSQALWDKGIWHAFRIWDGNAHDWPCWHEMVLHYVGGPDSHE